MCVVPTRKVSVRLTSTYAGFSGESTLLEKLYERGMAQPLVDDELHAGSGILFAWHTKPIAPWQTESWLQQMRASLRPNQFLRMIENRFVTSEEVFVDLAWWDACSIARPVVADPTMSSGLALMPASNETAPALLPALEIATRRRSAWSGIASSLRAKTIPSISSKTLRQRCSA
jgi:hypothetical protein